jgi:hypothetical protein
MLTKRQSHNLAVNLMLLVLSHYLVYVHLLLFLSGSRQLLAKREKKVGGEPYSTNVREGNNK